MPQISQVVLENDKIRKDIEMRGEKQENTKWKNRIGWKFLDPYIGKNFRMMTMIMSIRNFQKGNQ